VELQADHSAVALPPAGQAPTRAEGPVPAGPDSPQAYISFVLPPQLATRYRLTRRIGDGGEAVVWECSALDGGPSKALKVFQRTPEYALALDHPDYARHFDPAHVVRVEERGNEGEVHFELMEFCKGGSLQDLLQKRGTGLPIGQVVEIAAQLVEALDGMHPYIHADLKPSNVLIRSENPLDVVLADFGVTVALSGRTHVTNVGQKGTAAYLGPGDADQLTAKTDWWSLGMTLLDLVRGSNVFQYEDGRWMSEEAIRADLARRSVPLEDVEDERLRLLLRGLLTRDPQGRWGAPEARAWVNGKTPALAEDVLAKGQHPLRPCPVSLGGKVFRDAHSFAAALRSEWREAAARIGAGAEMPAVLDWATEATGRTDVAPIRDAAKRGSAKLAVALLAAHLDPTGPTVFGGFDVGSTASLAALAVDESPGVAPVLKDLLAGRIVSRLASGPQQDALILLQDRWVQLHSDVERLATSNLRSASNSTVNTVEENCLRRFSLMAALPAGPPGWPENEAVEVAEGGGLELEWFRKVWDDASIPAQTRFVFALSLGSRATDEATAVRAANVRAQRERQAQERSRQVAALTAYNSTQQMFATRRNAITRTELKAIPTWLGLCIPLWIAYLIGTSLLEPSGHSNVQAAQGGFGNFFSTGTGSPPVGFFLQPAVALLSAVTICTAARATFGKPTWGKLFTLAGFITGAFFWLGIDAAFGPGFVFDPGFTVFLDIGDWLAFPLWVAGGHAAACLVSGEKYRIDAEARRVPVPGGVPSP
jgi:hypothetical protein